jgi:pseudouridine-5'-phosphate glycosidase
VGVEVGLEAEAQVRSAGAVPATVGVLDGSIVVGLTGAEIDRFGEAGQEARKTGPRDLAAWAVQGAVGATTVGGTLAACRLAGIRFSGTGGIGGVHRGFVERPDVSADLAELARTPALVVSSGVKSLLDVSATAELLETLGVPVLGYRTDELPLFYSAGGGPPVSARVESADEAARVAAAHWELGGAALLLGRPADETVPNAESLIEEALQAAAEQSIAGQDVTPFVLSFLQERSGGRALAVNRDLIVANARLAAEAAVAFAAS